MFRLQKQDSIYIIILTVLFFCLIPFFYAKWGNPFFDFGREMYFPQLMLEGKVLYKDMLNMYGPFSYQLNAFLYFLFGVKNTVLFNFGILNTLIILFLSYFIVRSYSEPLTAFVSSIATFALIFRMDNGNSTFSSYFFPYSFAIVYAMTFTLLIIFSMIRFMKTKKIKYVYWGTFFIGLSLVTKLDFLLFYLFAFLFFMVSKNINIRQKLVSVLILLLPVLISWGVLFLQGIDVSDIQNVILFNHKFQMAQSVRLYNETVIGSIFNLNILIDNLRYFSLYLLLFAFLFLISFVIVNFIENITFFNLFFVLLIFPVIRAVQHFIEVRHTDFYMVWHKCFYDSKGYDCTWAWFSLLITGILIFCILYFRKNPLTTERKMFLLFLCCSVLINIRYFWSLKPAVGANFSLIVYFLVAVSFLMEIVKTKFFKKVFTLTFMFLVIIHLSRYIHFAQKQTYLYENEKGKFYFDKKIGTVVDSLNTYISEHSDNDTQILMIPESPFVSYFTGVKSYPEFYTIIPHTLEAIGEDVILKKLVNNMPDYVIIDNVKYFPYPSGWFGSVFGKDIMKFVNDNYVAVKRIYMKMFKEVTIITIYKRLEKTGERDE